MKIVKVVAAVIKKENEVLIAQRLKGDFAGLWEFPGGKVEKGETNEEALKREIMEEMELPIDVNEYLTTVEYDYPSFHLSMDCYLCELKNEFIQLHDHTAYRWISINDQLADIKWVPADVAVIQAAIKKLMR